MTRCLAAKQQQLLTLKGVWFQTETLNWTVTVSRKLDGVEPVVYRQCHTGRHTHLVVW